MKPEEWMKFFELVGKIVNLNLPVASKIETVKEKAEELDQEGNFEELMAWNVYP